MTDMEQQIKDANTAPSHKNYSDRKRNAMLKLYTQPLWPRLALVLFVCLLALTAALTIAEFFHSRFLSEAGALLQNLSATGLGIWSLYAIPLILVCILGMCFNRKRFYRQQAESEIFAQTEAERRRDRRAIRRLNRGYIGYICVSLLGILIWGILFLAVR